MELSLQEFLGSVSNKSTKKEYRWGINLFCEWYGKSVEEILKERQDDMTQKAGENLIEFRNRSARFSKTLEKFHDYLLSQNYSINTARNLIIGVRQLFRFYEMPVLIRNGSKVSQTVESTSDFPLTIETVRAMFQVADLRERVILSLATDLGLRIGDFLALKKTALPGLSQEAPISFVVMTDKKKIVAKGFLSQESVDLLKLYLPTLEKKENQYLFPSNGKSHISDEWLNDTLRSLASKAGIATGDKSLHFHLFRKMFLSAGIDSGCGFTAAKLMCGKSIAKSDSTYLTVVNLKQKFLQLKRFLTIQEQPKVETEKLETLKSAVAKLQEELTQQKVITDTVSEENVKTKQELSALKASKEEMLEQLNALQSEVARVTSTLDMIPGGFGPRRPSKEAKKSVSAATKKIAPEYVTEK
ncbi:MAG TPA: tyrosine-type recombinase/integrase [candidate division Zixibacteria bacterium]|nr:tyrosine-type recombinase/integrase [candidate division Zixibacteria bacterium]